MPDTSTKNFTTFGALLKHLRRRARLTQRDSGLAVGYSEAYITRLEDNSRLPLRGIVKSHFIDALSLQDEPDLSQWLIGLAEATRGQARKTEDGAFASDATSRNSNLTPYLTRFIGRRRELAEVEQLVMTYRLVTLTGSGGVGKTRLAQEVWAAVLDRFADGVWLVELALLTDPTLVTQKVADVLGVPSHDGATKRTDALDIHVAAKKELLILDNCVHLIHACAELAESLLRSCPHLHILATSREALHIPGEVTWRVPPLSVDESVALFAYRAAAAKPGFVVDDRDGAVVASIGQRLDGIPLAIELAASRVSGLSVEQLASRGAMANRRSIELMNEGHTWAAS